MKIATPCLMVAFSSYYASQMAILTSFGVLLSCTIGFALFSDLLLMPARLLWLKPLGPEHPAVIKNPHPVAVKETRP